MRFDVLSGFAESDLPEWTDFVPADYFEGDWGAEFASTLDFQTINGADVYAWSFGPGNPAGLEWNLIQVPGYQFETYPFTRASPPMTIPENYVVANGKLVATIGAAIQPITLYDPDTDNCFFGHVGDGAIIESAQAEIQIDGLTGSFESERFECIDGVVSPLDGYPVVESFPPAIRFVLLGGIRIGTGVRAGTQWFPLAASGADTGVLFESGKKRVIDFTAIAQAWHENIRKSRYHVFGLMPIIGTEPAGTFDDPVAVLKSLLLPHEFSVYESPARTTAGARGGSAYYPDPPTGNVDKVFTSRKDQASVTWTGLSGGKVNIVWKMPADWAQGVDAVHANWPPLTALPE
jgi:hypothetical protein